MQLNNASNSCDFRLKFVFLQKNPIKLQFEAKLQEESTLVFVFKATFCVTLLDHFAAKTKISLFFYK